MDSKQIEVGKHETIKTQYWGGFLFLLPYVSIIKKF